MIRLCMGCTILLVQVYLQSFVHSIVSRVFLETVDRSTVKTKTSDGYLTCLPWHKRRTAFSPPAGMYIKKNLFFRSFFFVFIPSTLLSSCCGTPTPGVLPPTPACSLRAPNGRRSGGPFPQLARSTHLRQDPWKWHGGVAGEWTALPHPGDALSHLGDRAPPTLAAMALLAPHPPLLPPSQARCRWRWWWCSRAPLVLAGARAQLLAASSPR
jgi:hypothetical protein